MKKGKNSTTEPHFEFGGPVGAIATTVALPLLVVIMFFACSPKYCLDFNLMKWSTVTARISDVELADLFDPSAFAVLFAWLAFQALLERCLPATIVQGTPLGTSGNRLDYRINGHAAFWVSLATVLGLHFSSMFSFDLTYCYDKYLQLAVASIVVSTGLAVGLYIASFRDGSVQLAHGGNTGVAVYDFFIGRELNPRIAGTTFDLKYFCELRPGLIGWTVINLGCLLKQSEITPAMIFVNVFQALYVWDALYHEKCILTTMDIINDGFGFMLAFGDLAWVPFTYSLQARYLVFAAGISNTTTVILVCLFNIAGYYIFRMSNAEKDAFRTDPDGDAVAHLKSIKTGYKGRRLLVSGWFGSARKINYTGDWMMGTAWCMYCGSDALLPYFYSIYFFILLAHRAFRDDEQCYRKYGKDWNAYKKQVPYVFIPGVI